MPAAALLTRCRQHTPRLTETDLVRAVVQNEIREASKAAASYGCDVVKMLHDAEYDGPTVRCHARIAFRLADIALRLEGR